MSTRTINLSLNVGVFDVEGLHAAAVKAYTGGRDSDEERRNALEWLGTAENPRIENCLVELWAEHCPVEAGYEFLTWEGTDA